MDRRTQPSSETPASVEDRLLDEALAMKPGARAEWLVALEREAPALAARVRALVAELDAGDGFLPPGGALKGVLFGDLRDQLSDEPAPSPSLAVGDEVGPHRIVERIGVGGMGEVYRARDTRLGRDVAVKVLPPHLEGGRQRLARLQREARVLAALNHPNIATIYGLERLGETTALVLELVDGPTLAETLACGPLTVPDAISVARQLVDALEAAHARGIVHRDLKPANVKVAGSGRLRVLDFGIATVLRDETGKAMSPDLPSLATLSLPSGAAIGTAAYMSPEQVRGEAVDQRADVWAFGCVLFEMLTGSRAFTGESTADVMVGVIGREPAFAALPAGTPTPLRALIEQCLQKDPRRRLETIGEARVFLEAAASLSAAPGSTRRSSVPVEARRSSWGTSRVALGLVLGAAVSGSVVWRVMQPAPQPVARLTVPVPSADELVTGALPAVALSPDGTTVVYRARRNGRLQLFRRSLDEAEPRVIPDSVNGMAPFFSPDGAWVGFDRDGVLMKAPAAGGSPVTISDTGGASAAASWGDRGEIVFAPTNGRGLFRVAAAGGDAVALTRIDERRGDVLHTLPDVLPGGRAVVFTVEGERSAMIATVRVDSGEVRLLTEGRQARYVPSGHLLVLRGDAIWAAPFNGDTLELGAEPVPVLRGLDSGGPAHFAVARNGSLVYVPPRDLNPSRDIVWIDRQGGEAPSGVEAQRHLQLSLSPDGTRAVLVIADAGSENLWAHDFARRTLTRLTFDPGVDTAPVWSPDGRTIVFRSDRDGGGLFRVSADGIGKPERLVAARSFLTPYAFTPDGQQLLYTESRSDRDQGIGVLDLRDRRQKTVIDDPSCAELRPALSPDGRWLAYQSNESGEFEVYLRPFPRVDGGKWQASSGGGRSPQWGPGGRELFFFEGETLVRVPITGSQQPVVGSPERLFTATLFGERLGPVYAVSPDGRRFLVIRDNPQRDRVAERRQLLLVQNWVTELAMLAPHRR